MSALCPLWEAPDPQESGDTIFVYTPFSTSDLYNSKGQNTPFSKDPENTSGGSEALTQYRQLFLAAIHGAAKNLSKVLEVRHLADVSPSALLERLLEAYRLYTPIDCVKHENARAITIAFVSQSTPRIEK